MTIKSLGSTLATFKDIFGKTGTRASNEYVPPPFTATGGNVSALAPGNGYKYHTFTSSGTFTVSSLPEPKTIEVLVVGGGGGGGNYNVGGNGGGGGGAGGMVYHPAIPISIGSYPVTVGAGGNGGGGAGGSMTSGFSSIAGVSGTANTGGGGGGALKAGRALPRFLVRIKQELISMGQSGASPSSSAPSPASGKGCVCSLLGCNSLASIDLPK